MHVTISSNSSYGKTPLHLAAQNGHYSVLAFLLDHQQTPDTAIEITDNKNVCLRIWLCLLTAIKYTCIFILTTKCSALCLACKEGHAKCVEVLLKGGAKVTYSTHDMSEIKSCLEIAILRQNRYGAVYSVTLT